MRPKAGTKWRSWWNQQKTKETEETKIHFGLSGEVIATSNINGFIQQLNEGGTLWSSITGVLRLAALSLCWLSASFLHWLPCPIGGSLTLFASHLPARLIHVSHFLPHFAHLLIHRTLRMWMKSWTQLLGDLGIRSCWKGLNWLRSACTFQLNFCLLQLFFSLFLCSCFLFCSLAFSTVVSPFFDALQRQDSKRHSKLLFFTIIIEFLQLLSFSVS